MIKLNAFITCVCGLLVLGAGTARASTSDRNKPVQDLAQSADLVFHGEVISVEHRMSEASDDRPDPSPHTFVTYHVTKVMKGHVDGDTITLRFLGGPIDSDRYFKLAGVPLFDKGDEDVLMVKDNLKSECPLVDCATGRFRFIEGMVVNDRGQRMQVDADDELVEGPAMALDDVDNHRMSDSIQLHKIEIDDAEGYDTRLLPGAPLDPKLDLKPAQFVDYIADQIEASASPDQLAAANTVTAASADISQPFTAWSVPMDDYVPDEVDPGKPAAPRGAGPARAASRAERSRGQLGQARDNASLNENHIGADSMTGATSAESAHRGSSHWMFWLTALGALIGLAARRVIILRRIH